MKTNYWRLIIPVLLFSNSLFAQMPLNENNGTREIWGEIEAKKTLEKSVIRFSVLIEDDAEFYFAQHSIDGKEWRVIGKIPPGVTVGKTGQYQVTHKSPVRAVNYYRILQVNKDGSQEFSKVVALRWDLTRGSIVAAPNPCFTGEVFVTCPTDGILQVFDTDGYFVKQQDARGGVNKVNLSNMPRGIYTIRVGEKLTSIMVDMKE